ncbi:hypothetical protein LTR50_007860 [Elasticomyces elasticus]|nr:hypothetical protein LTR50_007860 [Elasticomyces elasticus]
MSSFNKIPSGAKQQPKPFKANIEEEKLSEFKQLLKLSKLGPVTYENQQEDRRYGVTRQWMKNAKEHWETKFDWRKQEEHINSFPNYTIPIKDDDGHEFTVHFVALFSEKEDAVPIGLYHGWPGSFLEFLTVLELLKSKYSPSDLPYHIIAPSLPGYAYSSSPPLDKDWTTGDTGRIMHKLMLELGFDSYLAQGGDIGSFVARYLAVKYDECKGMHINMVMLPPPTNADTLEANEAEKNAMPRGKAFNETGSAYAMEHGTRPATIGHVLSSSPLALLAWIGEKFLEWTDTDPPMDDILASVTLYWLTETFPRCIYSYRGIIKPEDAPRPSNPKYYVEKPFGYSWFPKELAPTPKSWAATTGNLVWHRQHDAGGHFAAMEKPKELLQDIEDFTQKVWKK